MFACESPAGIFRVNTHPWGCNWPVNWTSLFLLHEKNVRSLQNMSNCSGNCKSAVILWSLMCSPSLLDLVCCTSSKPKSTTWSIKQFAISWTSYLRTKTYITNIIIHIPIEPYKHPYLQETTLHVKLTSNLNLVLSLSTLSLGNAGCE